MLSSCSAVLRLCAFSRAPWHGYCSSATALSEQFPAMFLHPFAAFCVSSFKLPRVCVSHSSLGLGLHNPPEETLCKQSKSNLSLNSTKKGETSSKLDILLQQGALPTTLLGRRVSFLLLGSVLGAALACCTFCSCFASFAFAFKFAF